MTKTGAISILFWATALYDAVLGIVFLLAPTWAFRTAGIPMPDHMGYVQFAACLLLVFAAMFVRIARAPAANRSLIPYGIGLKASYCGVVAYNCATVGIQDIWKVFAVVDLITAILFVAAWIYLGKSSRG